MSAQLLTLNAGSSSLKFALYAADDEGRLGVRTTGQIEGLGVAPHLVVRTGEGALLEDLRFTIADAPDHASALRRVLAALRSAWPALSVDAVSHRVVHGGPARAAPVVVDDAVLDELAAFEPFAPLHQPHNLAGIRAARSAFPGAVQVACFDTAFHRMHPWVNDTFALPRRYYDRGVRRYGFHGLSYEYVARRLAQTRPEIAGGRVVVAHLGSGASMCAIRNGQSVGSTMGFSALDGLPMGTRCGQLDPGVLLYLMDQEGLTSREISDLLYKESGLKGLSGLSNDMRLLEASDAREAAEAIDYFVFRIRRELGAMAAILGGLDALVFCGGIGENSVHVRERVCAELGWLGATLDDAANRESAELISSPDSRVRILVVRTNEEAMLADHALRLLREREPSTPRQAQSGAAATRAVVV